MVYMAMKTRLMVEVEYQRVSWCVCSIGVHEWMVCADLDIVYGRMVAELVLLILIVN
jgi:hypothetical protein